MSSPARVRRLRWLRWLGALVALVLVAGLWTGTASPAYAAPTLLPLVEVQAPGGEPAGWDLALAPADTTVAVWSELGADTLRVATWVAGEATYTTIAEFSTRAVDAQVFVDAEGAITVAWLEFGGTVRVSRRPAGSGGFTTPTGVTLDKAQAFVLLGSPAGAVTVVSRHAGASEAHATEAVLSTTLPAHETTWIGPALITRVDHEAAEGNRLGALRAGVDGAGTVSATWVAGSTDASDDGQPVGTIFTSMGTSAAGFSVPDARNDDGTVARQPDLAVTEAGDVTVAWSQQGAEGEAVLVSSRTSAGDFGIPEPVGESAGAIRRPRVVEDARGTITVAWSTGQLGQVTVWTRTSVGATTEQTVVEVDGWAGLTDLALSPNGAVALTSEVEREVDDFWVRGLIAYRAAGSSDFGAPTDLDDLAPSDATHVLGPRLSIAGTGDVTALWPRMHLLDPSTPTFSLMSSVLDVAGPQLDPTAIPATATIGSASQMSVAVADAWSEPSNIAWDFGDGGTGTGTGVWHAYAATGTYSVTVTATDAVGNSTTTSRPIIVTAAVVPAPPPAPPPPADTTPPSLSKAKVTPRTLLGPKRVKLTATTTEAATLRAVIDRLRGKRWRTARTVSWKATTGSTSAVLYRPKAAARLAAGTYRIRLAATDAVGNRSSTVTLRWRVSSG